LVADAAAAGEIGFESSEPAAGVRRHGRALVADAAAAGEIGFESSEPAAGLRRHSRGMLADAAAPRETGVELSKTGTGNGAAGVDGGIGWSRLRVRRTVDSRALPPLVTSLMGFGGFKG
jgi:hypothetical protein